MGGYKWVKSDIAMITTSSDEARGLLALLIATHEPPSRISVWTCAG